jgi:hypothetical protein
MTQSIKIVLSAFSILLVGLFFSLGPVYSQNQPLTAEQILANVDARGSFGGVGSAIGFSTFDIIDKTGSEQKENFVDFSKNSSDPTVPNRVLIYFLEPPKETCGTIFFSLDHKVAGQKSDLYLFLPALSQTKQLVSTSERKGSFAGSNISFDQIGRSELHTDFNVDAQVGEDTVSGVTIDGQKQDRKAYVLHLTANPQTNPDDSFPDRKIWVDEQEFITLKSEETNTIGKLQNLTSIGDLVTFEGRLEANTIKVQNILDNSSTTVTITGRQDVGDLPDSIFVPDSLPQFDARQFNDKLQIKVPDPTCP